MPNIKKLGRTDTQALNWKAALRVLGLATALLVVGGNSQAAPSAERSDAVLDFSSCGKPVWPEAALREKQAGTVTLKFLVGVDGKAKDSQVVRSSRNPSLDEAARSGIALCRFKPAVQDGAPVEDWVHVQYVWTHDNKQGKAD